MKCDYNFLLYRVIFPFGSFEDIKQIHISVLKILNKYIFLFCNLRPRDTIIQYNGICEIAIINRPGVAGAVLQSPSSLIHPLVPNTANPKPEELGS